MIKLKRINNHKVVPMKGRKKDTRPVLGGHLFALNYATILCLARKKSGKTEVLFDILRSCVARGAIVHAYVATLNHDPTWLDIKDWCEEHGIGFDGYTSMFDDDDGDRLDRLVRILDKEREEALLAEQESETNEPITILTADSDDDDEPRKPRKAKYQSPEHVFIFDDLSDELKGRVFKKFLKNMRHYKPKVIISTQDLGDMLPGSRKQLDYWILFKGQSLEKLATIHNNASLDMPVEDFFEYYKEATKEPYSFLYVDARTGALRKRFDQEFQFTEK